MTTGREIAADLAVRAEELVVAGDERVFLRAAAAAVAIRAVERERERVGGSDILESRRPAIQRTRKMRSAFHCNRLPGSVPFKFRRKVDSMNSGALCTAARQP